MAYASITKPSLHFNTKTYTGTGSTHNVTGVGFQPDLTWIKCSSHSDDHNLVDVVRGVTKYLQSNSNIAEATYSGNVSAFGTDGFTVGDGNQVNQNGRTFVSWNFKAGNSSGSANTSGSTNSTVSVNTTAGFSIVKYTGTGSNATVGHGLGAVPKMIFIKRYDGATENWGVYHVGMGNTKYQFLNLGNTEASSSGYWNDTTPTSTLFSIGTNDVVNTNGGVYVAYCFADVKGFSKFFKYEGNGNVNGAYIYTGFKPAFVLLKCLSAGGNWLILDDKRETKNILSGSPINANESNAQDTNANYSVDFYANGFKMRNTNGNIQNNTNIHMYAAFASNPLVVNQTTNGLPTTAQ